jgi:hypothetical protein
VNCEDPAALLAFHCLLLKLVQHVGRRRVPCLMEAFYGALYYRRVVWSIMKVNLVTIIFLITHLIVLIPPVAPSHITVQPRHRQRHGHRPPLRGNGGESARHKRRWQAGHDEEAAEAGWETLLRPHPCET